jgi:hypothetical protein
VLISNKKKTNKESACNSIYFFWSDSTQSIEKINFIYTALKGMSHMRNAQAFQSQETDTNNTHQEERKQ